MAVCFPQESAMKSLLKTQTGYTDLITAITVIVDFVKESQYISGSEFLFMEASGFNFYKHICRDIQ